MAEALALVLALLALAGTLAAAAVHSRWPVEAVAAVATAAGLVAVEALSVSDARQAPARERCHYQVAPCRGVGCEDRRHALLRFLARPPGSAWPARPSRREPGAKDIELMILRRELHVLRRQISRPAIRPADRAFLAAAACHLPRSAKPLLLVTPRTLLRWAAGARPPQVAPGQQPARPTAALGGDPATRAPARTREPMLGSSPDLRCAGKLGLRASPTSVRRAARARPAASRAAAGGPSWREFLQAQAASIVACDFFTVESVLLRRSYVLFFVEHGSRRAHLAGCTTNPDGSWVAQHARNVGFFIAEQQIRFRCETATASRPADEVSRGEQIMILPTPVRAPKANAIAEGFVRTVGAECLDCLLILNRRHLERVLRVYIEHYNAERPHRAVALRRPDPPSALAGTTTDEIRRRDKLGGPLHEYYRAAPRSATEYWHPSGARPPVVAIRWM